MTTAKKKKIATWIIVPLMLGIFLFDIFTVVLGNVYNSRLSVTAETFDGSYTDRIHFLNTANSDAILIESDGRFALVDSGEGSENPRRKGDYPGFERTVIDYIKKVAVGEDGKAHLDFILGTHAHYDHIGCFHAILQDTDILVDKAYFKRYTSEVGKKYESSGWDIGNVYAQIVEDLRQRDIPLIQDLPDAPFPLGNFTVQFFNTVTPQELYGQGENAASVGVKVTKGERSAFLAADITRTTGLAQRLADEIGRADVLKIGHHGYYGSGSMHLYEVLRPQIAVVTNRLGKIYPNEKWMLILKAHVPILATYENDGVIVSFPDDGSLVVTNHIHG